MRLRHQLLLVSLLILCLPWAGCQFVRETESAMLLGQERALIASARAASLGLGADGLLDLAVEEFEANGLEPIYFHSLGAEPVVDGFDEDWRQFSFPPAEMRANQTERLNSDTQPQLYAGRYGDQFYLLIQAPSNAPSYLDPSLDSLRGGDHLRIVRQNQPDLYLSTSAPGSISARYLDGEEIRFEYGLSGVWNHTGDEYLIELHMRPRLLHGNLGIEFLSFDLDGLASSKIGLAENLVLPVVLEDQELSSALAVFATDGLRLSVIDAQGWLRGRSGKLASGSANRYTRIGFLTSLYGLILRDKNAEALPSWQVNGRIDAEDTQAALKGSASSALFQYGDLKVGRSSIPIVQDGIVVGAVIAEQATDSLTTTTNTAFNRLMLWSFFAMLTVGLGLLLFASLLSFRIRKLSKAAESAVDEGGNLVGNFPVSNFDDEVGDLSRSFDQLLTQVRDYNDYLKSLSGKLSHELKTPLAVVRSSLDNLEQQSLTEEAQLYTERASQGAARLSAIFAALSGASRLEQSIGTAEFESVVFADFLKELFAAYVDAYREQRFELVITPDTEELRVKICLELIAQMLDKLVDNATDFSTEIGAVVITLVRDENELILSVSNDGPLLPDEMSAQLFDSLVSVRGEKTQDMHLGLGLYIARLIAQSHGGSIRLRNRPDSSGVTVVVRLPLNSDMT